MGSRRIASFVSFAAMFAACVVAQGRTNGTCRIRARIVDENGKPIAGAGAVFGEVGSVTTNDALQRPAARSNAEGVLELVLVVPRDQTTPTALWIAAPGKVAFRCPCFERPFPMISTDQVAVDLGDVWLPVGHTLSGRVRDADGKAIAGALVTAFDELDKMQQSVPTFASCTRTNADGVFSLPGVFAEAIRVAVQANGCLTKVVAGAALGTALDIRMVTSGFVEGAAFDASGKPMSGRVRCLYQFDDRSTSVAVDANGTFRVPVEFQGQMRLSLHAADASVVAESDVLDGPRAGVLLREIPADQCFVIRAKSNATGEALRSLRAAAFWRQGDRNPGIELWLERTLVASRADGAVQVTAPTDDDARKGLVLVRAARFAPFVASGVLHRPGEAFVADLLPESVIRGTVLGADEKPIAGARVVCQQKSIADTPRVLFAGSSDVGDNAFVTGADGSFAFRQLGAEPYVVEAWHPDGTSSATNVIEPKVGEVVDDVVLSLPAGTTVRGRLSGTPDDVAWRFVLAAQRPEAAPTDRSRGRLAAWNRERSRPVRNGAFEFGHRAPGKETLWLLVPQSPRQGSTVVIPLADVDIEGEDVTIDVDLATHRPGRITGKVVVRGIEIPPGRLVVVATRADTAPRRAAPIAMPSADRHWALVRPDGAFDLVLPPGDHEMSIVDSATGLTVHHGASVKVAAGRAVDTEIRCEVAVVRVSFEHGPGERLTAPRLNLTTNNKTRWPEAAIFGFDAFGFTGCDVASIGDTLSFFAEPGQLRLALFGAATSIRRGTRTLGSIEMTDVPVDVIAGERNEVMLRMPPPVDLATK